MIPSTVTNARALQQEGQGSGIPSGGGYKAGDVTSNQDQPLKDRILNVVEGDPRTIADSSDSGAPVATYSRVPVFYILLYSTLMALASGLGAVPFFIFGRLKPHWAGIANAVAVGEQ